jgi:hypothetical protein
MLAGSGKVRDLPAGLKPGTEIKATVLRAGRTGELTGVVP